MNGVIRRRETYTTKQTEDKPYIGEWVANKRFNTARTAIIDAPYMITPYYKVNPGDTITFNISDNYTCVLEFENSNLEFDIYKDLSKNIDFWAQTKWPRTVTLSNKTYFIVCAISISRLDTGYILNNTTNQYLYKK